MAQVSRLPRMFTGRTDADPYEQEALILHEMVKLMFGSGMRSAQQHRVLTHLTQMWEERSQSELKPAWSDSDDGVEK